MAAATGPQGLKAVGDGGSGESGSGAPKPSGKLENVAWNIVLFVLIKGLLPWLHL